MPKRIPIAAARRVAEEQSLKQVVLLAYDGDHVHVVTYGATKADCEAAAESGRWIMSALESPVPIEPPTFAFPDHVRARIAGPDRAAHLRLSGLGAPMKRPLPIRPAYGEGNACLHCLVWDVIHDHSPKAPDGQAMYDPQEIIGNLSEIIAEIIAGNPDRPTRRRLLDQFNTDLRAYVAQKIASGDHPRSVRKK
jgi:hypothetical protein